MNRFPLTLNHPHYKPGKATAIPGHDPVSGRPVVDYQGTPDRFPPVTVHNDDQEAEARSRGYLEPGESRPVVGYSEYPKMLVHPEHVDAIPDEVVGHRDEKSGAVTTTVVKGVPEKHPPVTVKNADEEKAALAKGFKAPGTASPEAIESYRASPGICDYEPPEYPKMVDGALVHAPESGVKPGDYPKWITAGVDGNGDPTGQSVNSPAEEAALLVKLGRVMDIVTAPGTSLEVAAHVDAVATLIRAETRHPDAVARDADPSLGFGVSDATPGPGTVNEPVLSRGQKAAETRRRNAAAKAA